ncbi:MAG: hypothetical protein A3G08_04805 [Candidatus Magasanikbacteria bacterium RIFCSPLOWO2_12_FULL_47_9b]|nr:MAG: hypothetical protein A3G08_04805 [Candidatus Magasanikbacteria bacterium RIFCSPLOWO2_12_FULL_47_9b]
MESLRVFLGLIFLEEDMEGHQSFFIRVKHIARALGAVLFPLFCLGCGQEGRLVCETCLLTLESRPVFLCPVCHRHGVRGQCCSLCASQSFLSSVCALFPYDEKDLGSAILRFAKYHSAQSLFSVFEPMIHHFSAHNAWFLSEIDCLMPVPLHAKRLRERGFNQ